MELTGRQVMAAQTALRMLGCKQIKIGGAVKVAKTLIELSTVADVLEKRRRALLDEMALKLPDGKLLTDDAGNATFADGDQARFVAAYNALLDEPVEVEAQQISARDLGEIEIAPDALGPLVAVGVLI